MIDISTEHLLTMTEAARLLPGRPSTCTLWRWRTRGVDGRVLESVTVGGRTYTSREALQRFAAHRGGQHNAPTLRTTGQRERAISRAERELDQAGI